VCSGKSKATTVPRAEFETTIRAMGDAFQLQVHGDGLLATMLQLGAELVKE
jgi:hypothetical protein